MNTPEDFATLTANINQYVTALKTELGSASYRNAGELYSTEINILDATKDKFSTSATLDIHKKLFELDPTIHNRAFEKLAGLATEIKTKHYERISRQNIETCCSWLAIILYLSELMDLEANGVASMIDSKSSSTNTKIIEYPLKAYERNEGSGTLIYKTWLLCPHIAATFKNQLLKKDMEASITSYTNLIEELDAKTVGFDTNIENQKKAFKNIIEASFTKLASSFRSFEWFKRLEKWGLLILCLTIGYTMISIATISLEQGHLKSVIETLPDWIIAKENSAALYEDLKNHLSPALPLIIAEGFLLYFFRIALNNYYAARDELLQLQLRKSLCLFAPQFKAFSTPLTDSDNSYYEDTPSNLDEFAKHIFSPLNSRMNPAPHPLDFLGQVTDAIKKVQK